MSEEAVRLGWPTRPTRVGDGQPSQRFLPLRGEAMARVRVGEAEAADPRLCAPLGRYGGADLGFKPAVLGRNRAKLGLPVKETVTTAQSQRIDYEGSSI